MKKCLVVVILILSMILLCSCGKETIEKINPDKYVVLADYKNIEIDKTEVDYTEEDLQNWMQKEIQAYIDALQLYEYVSVSVNEVSMNSIVEVSYKGMVDGIEVDGTTEKTYIDMASDNDRYLDGFKEGLVGKKIGDTVILDLVYPQQYIDSYFAGKPITYIVTINDIVKKQNPEINDDLISKFNIEGVATYDQYVEYCNKYMNSIYEEQSDFGQEELLWNSFYELCEVSEPPKFLVEEKREEIMEGYQIYVENSSTSMDELIESMGYDSEAFETMVNEKAIEQSKEELVYLAVAKAEKIEIENKDENGEKSEKEKSEERHKLVLNRIKSYNN